MRSRNPNGADFSPRSEIVSLREENSALLARVDTLEMSLEESKQNEDHFRRQFLQMQSKCASLTNEVQSLSRQLKTAIRQKRTTDAALSSYIDRQESHNAEKEKLHRKVLEAQHRWETSRDTVVASDRECRILREENKASEERIERLLYDTRRQNLQCDKLQRENDALRQQLAELARLSKEISDVLPQFARMKETCQEREATQATLFHEKAIADHEIETLRAKVQRLNREKAQLCREIRSKDVLNTNRQKIIAELQAEVDQLRSSFDHEGDVPTVVGLEEALGEVHQENAELKRYLATRKKLEDILARVNDSIASFSNIKGRVAPGSSTVSAVAEEEEEEDADEQNRPTIRDGADETSEVKVKDSGSHDESFE